MKSLKFNAVTLKLLLVVLCAGYSFLSYSKDDVAKHVVTVTAHGGGGYVLCNGEELRNTSVNVMVEDGGSLSVTGYPDNGYRVGCITKQQEGFMLTTTDYTNRTSVSRTAKISYIKQDASVDVYFEEIPNPIPSYSVTVTSYGEHGHVEYNGQKIVNGSKVFQVKEGGSLSVTGYPDKGYRVSRTRTQKDDAFGMAIDYTNRSSISRTAEVTDVKRDATIEFYYEQLEPADPVTITASDKTEIYDGNVHAISFSVPSNVPVGEVVKSVYRKEGEDWLPTSPSEVIGAGSYKFVFRIDTDLYIGETSAILTIKKASQTISWDQSLPEFKVTNKLKLVASSSSGLPVTFVSGNNSLAEVVTINGEQYLECKAPGMVKISARQVGNENYYSAVAVVKDVTIKDVNFSLISQLPDWKSPNKEHGTTSLKEYAFHASKGDMLSFDWFTSSEAIYDKLLVGFNGEDILSESGIDNAGTESIDISEDKENVMSVSYAKDGSYSAGLDEVSLSNIILRREAPNDHFDYVDIEDAYRSLEVKRDVEVDNLFYSRSFNNTKWQALYLPFSMSYDDWKDDFVVASIHQALQYDDNEDGSIDRNEIEVSVVESGILEPNTPYFIKAKSVGTKSLTLHNLTLCKTKELSTEVVCGDTKFLFTGTYHVVSGTEMKQNGHYAMGGGSLIHAASDDSNLGAFRWYMDVTDLEGNPKDVSEVKIFVFDDEWGATDNGSSTAIESMNCGQRATEVFDLYGRRVVNARKGIYVKNGKRYIVR